MIITARRLVVFTSVLLCLIGGALWFGMDPSSWRWLAGGLIALGPIGIVAALALHPEDVERELESDDIRDLDDARRRELIRGTSLSLREMEYRYSVRLDARDGSVERAFSAEVNSIRLGFVPAIITDNATDRQGFGFVAFVHDGARWRGPGLPCPAGQAEAVAPRNAVRGAAGGGGGGSGGSGVGGGLGGHDDPDHLNRTPSPSPSPSRSRLTRAIRARDS